MEHHIENCSNQKEFEVKFVRDKNQFYCQLCLLMFTVSDLNNLAGLFDVLSTTLVG